MINFDFPMNINDYIHRCGRIGRVGGAKNCVVTNFVTGLNDVNLVQQIEHTVRVGGILPNVDANVTRKILEKVIGPDYKNMRDGKLDDTNENENIVDLENEKI